jgi:hypothetical protein
MKRWLPKLRRNPSVLGGLAFFLVAGCATAGMVAQRSRSTGEEASVWLPPATLDAYEKPRELLNPPAEDWEPYPFASALGEQVAEEANRWVGTPSLKGMEEGLNDDCMGLIRFIYERVGVEFANSAFAPGAVNAVNSLYAGARSAGMLHLKAPKRGDLVFFKETYDVNRDGLRNDGMTHIAIVEEVRSDGTLTFVHRERHGIKTSLANPLFPKQRFDAGGKPINDFIRRETLEHRGYLAGELVTGFVSPMDLQKLANGTWRRTSHRRVDSSVSETGRRASRIQAKAQATAR